MDVPKFISLLLGNLYFPCTSKLGDPFEGKYSAEDRDLGRRGLKLLRSMAGTDHISDEEFFADHFPSSSRADPVGQQHALDIIEISSALSQLAFVSCWHLNAGESAAMWNLYVKSGEGLAIRSSVVRLEESLRLCETQIVISKVLYYARSRPLQPMDPLELLLHKRKSYEHENEIRAIIPDFETVRSLWEDDALISPIDCRRKNELLAQVKQRRQTMPSGKSIPIDLNRLVDKVFLSPGMPDWFLTVIESLMDKYELRCEVMRSELDDLV